MIKKWTVLFLTAACCMVLAACGAKENKEQDAYRQYGITCMESGKYEEAVKAFQNALDTAGGVITEKELDICFYKAKAQALNNETDAAIETYQAVIDYKKDARAYYLRGSLYLDLGEQEKGDADFAEALERGKDNYEIYIGIYESLNSHDRTAEGQKVLSQALELKGDGAEDCLYKGRICYLLDEYEDALSYLTEAKKQNLVLASYYMGLVYEAQGDAQKAKASIQEYLDSGEASSYELYELGMTEMGDGDYESALTYFSSALALETVPNRQNLMKSMIAAYEYSGDFDSAKSLVKEYLKLYPSDEDVQREQTFLETR